MSGLMKWPGSRRHKAPGEWVKHATDKELDVLMGLTDLSKQGPLPSDAALLSQEIRTRAEMNMERAKMTFALPSPDNVTVPPGMSFTDWLNFKWRTANASVRHTLRTVADALGVPVPLTRTRNSSVGGEDSSPARRTGTERQPSQGKSEPAESPAEEEELEEPHYHDPPEWHDEHADGWTPCESLHDAFRSDTEWY